MSGTEMTDDEKPILLLKHTSKSDLFLLMISTWWGISLFFNDSLFDQVPEIYESIAAFAGEKIWSMIFFLIAVMNLFGMIFDIGRLRKWTLGSWSLLYAVITAGYLWSNAPLNTGTGIYFSITVLCMWRLREVKLLYA